MVEEAEVVDTEGTEGEVDNEVKDGGAKDTKTGTEGTGEKDDKGASGEGESSEEDKGGKGEESSWPDDWRERAAKHYAAGDEKAYARELKRLGRIKDPEGLYGMYREAETKISSNKAIFKPGKDATEDDVKAYRKQLGVPDAPEDYLKNLKMANGETLGDEDQEIATDFAKQMHEAGATQETMNAALNWYYARQEEAAALQDDQDEYGKYEAEKALKEEFGAAYKRKTAAISSLFAQAPGGADISNPESLYARLVGGRLADGTLVGNDPDMVRFLSDLAGDVNPAASTLPDGLGNTQSLEDEIKEIEKLMRTNKREYFRNHAGRYAELLDARERMRARD